MDIEKQNIAICRAERLKPSHRIGGHPVRLLWIARIGRFTVCDMNHDGRKATRVQLKPRFNPVIGYGEGLRHGSSSICHWLKPDRKFDFLLNEPTCSIVCLL